MVELLTKEVERDPHRLQTTARLLIAYRATGKPERAEKAKALSQEVADALARPGCATSELGQRVATAIEAGVTARPQPEGETAGFAADFGVRPTLASLGPAARTPMPAVGFDLPVAGGGRRTLAPGKPTLVVFYLGFGCLHCVEQLQALAPKAAAFAELGIDVVAIGTDTAEKAAESLWAMAAPERFTFPLLADPSLEAFKACAVTTTSRAYRCTARSSSTLPATCAGRTSRSSRSPRSTGGWGRAGGCWRCPATRGRAPSRAARP